MVTYPYLVIFISYSYKMVYGRTSKRLSRKRVSKRYLKTPFRRYNSKALVSRAKTKTLVKLIKGVTLKQSETCYRTGKATGFVIKHNGITQVPMWYPAQPLGQNMMPTQGHTDGNRNGDEIMCQGIKVRGVLTVPHDRRATIVRMYYLPYNTVQGDPTQRDQLFHNTIGNVLVDPIQTDRWKGIKYLGSYRIKARDLEADDHATIIINKWIPMKKKVTFLNDGTDIPANLKENGVILFTAYDTIGALQDLDTLIDNSQITFTLYYKDP